jgi:hypothetical protein
VRLKNILRQYIRFYWREVLIGSIVIGRKRYFIIEIIDNTLKINFIKFYYLTNRQIFDNVITFTIFLICFDFSKAFIIGKVIR